MSVGLFWYGIRVLLAWVKEKYFIYKWAGGTLQKKFFKEYPHLVSLFFISGENLKWFLILEVTGRSMLML